tara:strand:+ start:291 stop:593 length:303 start_codon:yes stop_codon:yes gene_type:complete
MSSSITFILCSSSSVAQGVVDDVKAGELWGVNMGTTSKSSSYSNYALVEATETRTLALLESVPDDGKFDIQSSELDVDSFTESYGNEKLWFLRGKRVGEE